MGNRDEVDRSKKEITVLLGDDEQTAKNNLLVHDGSVRGTRRGMILQVTGRYVTIIIILEDIQDSRLKAMDFAAQK